MKVLVMFLLYSVSLAAVADTSKLSPVEAGTKVYETDAYGRVRYNRPSWVVTDKGRLVEVSPYGRPQPQKQQYAVKGDRVYAASATGQIQYNKPSWTVGKDGRVIQNDAFGNPQYHKPQYVVKDGKVYATSAIGQLRRPLYEIKK